MKEHGTFLVPTLYTLDFIIDEGPESGVPEYAVEKAKAMAKQQRERLARRTTPASRFAYGTDAAVFPHGRNAKDFQILVEELDVQPIDAIRMATVNAAPSSSHATSRREATLWRTSGSSKTALRDEGGRGL